MHRRGASSAACELETTEVAVALEHGLANAGPGARVQALRARFRLPPLTVAILMFRAPRRRRRPPAGAAARQDLDARPKDRHSPSIGATGDSREVF
jgi:hypothetical protein